MRELVFAFPLLPVSDGDVLYTCKVAINPTAADGVYPLHGTNASASDEFGSSIRIQMIDGNITVGPTIHDAPASLILRTLHDVLLDLTLPASMSAAVPPLGATCAAPPVIDFAGTANRCIIAP